jgi:SagB-type dehydrogenase family enzyme
VTQPPLPTVDAAARIFGGVVALDDPAETYHEASRLAPSTIGAAMSGSRRLAADPLLHVSAARASRRHGHRPGIDLPPARLPRMRLRDAFTRRRSSIDTDGRPPEIGQLAALLSAAYGRTLRDGAERRAVPSAGALYPLELYVAVRRVKTLAPGVYHYDPFRHRLEVLSAEDPSAAARAALPEPRHVDATAAFLAITAVFSRSRFKYGQRGYRFALLEAGHVAQNAVLAAAALGLSVLPYGGYYDLRLDEIVGADGLHESTVHLLLVGGAGA